MAVISIVVCFRGGGGFIWEASLKKGGKFIGSLVGEAVGESTVIGCTSM